MATETQENIGGLQAIGTIIDNRVLNRRYQQLKQRTSQFLQYASHKLANDDKYSYGQYLQEAAARGVNEMPEVKEYATIVKEADEVRKDTTARTKRGATLRSLANARVPVDPQTGALPPGFTGAEGGVAPGFENAQTRESLVTRPETEQEVTQRTGGITRGQLEMGASLEEQGMDFKGMMEIVKNLTGANVASQEAINNFMNASARTGMPKGGVLSQRDVLLGQSETEIGQIKPSQFASFDRGQSDVESKDRTLLLNAMKEIGDAQIEKGRFDRQSEERQKRTRDQASIMNNTIRPLLEKYPSWGSFKDVLNLYPEVSDLLNPSAAPADSTGKKGSGFLR